MPTRTVEPGPVAGTVAANLRALRLARGWSVQELADRVSRYHPLSRATITNLENDRREAITVDELAALARVFQVDPWSLTSTPCCLTCNNQAPAGFACLTCRRAGEPQ